LIYFFTTSESSVMSNQNLIAFRIKYFVFLITILSISSCASIDKEKIKTNASLFGSKISSGVSNTAKRFKTKGPSKKSRSKNNALTIAAKYPLSEVPHTLLRKPVASGRLTSGHGYRLSPTGIPMPRKHKGVDYAAPQGTEIYAAGDGTIDKLYESSSYGNYIRIEHENNFSTAYAHMNEFANGLEVGSLVSKGQIIGYVGSTGRSSGDHLHFELIYEGNFIDPLFESETIEPTADSPAE